ncbi:MAG: family 16 glycosylhydrolase [Clostridia bacterium]|nr:family 16 glycosylhydrolase [Clostridia bacterium]
MKTVKRIISTVLCLALLIPAAVIPAAAVSTEELEALYATAGALIYSDGTHASRRQLKAAYDTAEAVISQGNALNSDIVSATSLLSAAIDGFVAVEAPERREIAGIAAWDAATVSSFTDTSGCAVFFGEDADRRAAVKVVTAGKDVAYFSNAASDAAIDGASVFTGDITDTAGLRFRTSFNDLSLVESVSVSVGVRSADGRKTYTAVGIPAKNGYVAVDWEFFYSDYDAIGTGVDLANLNYVAFAFEGVKPGFIGLVSDLHCFTENILATERPEYREVKAASIISGNYYKIVDSNTGLALTLSERVTDTETMTATGYENRIVNKQSGLSVTMEARKEDPRQEWQIYRHNDGTFRIINKDSSLALSASYYVLSYTIDTSVLNLSDTAQEWRVARSSNGFKISVSSASAYYMNYSGGNLKASGVQQVWDVYECVRGEWNQVWNDEFDGDSIDRSKWTVYDAKNRGDTEPVYFRDNENNVCVSDGDLIIRTKRENYLGYPTTGAYLTTEGHYYTSFGRFEMRAKLAVGAWIWPAFWLQGAPPSNWPQNGEIDVMELVGGGKEDSKLYGTFHWLSDYADGSREFVKGVEFYNKNNVSLGDDYHTYAVEWEHDQMRIYFDGMQYVSLNLTSDSERWGYGDLPHYITLNTSIRGPGNDEIYPDTADESEFIIDYVRVSKRSGDMSASTETADSAPIEGQKIYAGIIDDVNVAASPDGNFFVVTNRYGDVNRFNARTGEKQSADVNDSTVFSALKYSPSGRFIAAGSRMSGLVIYKNSDLSSKSRATVNGLYFESLAFSADESTIYAGGRNDNQAGGASDNKYLYAFGTSSGSQRGKVYIGSDVRSIAVSDDGKYIAAGTSSGKIYVVDADTLAIEGECEMEAVVRSLAFIPSSDRFAASDEAGNIKVFDAETRGVVMTLDNPDGASVSSIEISPDGSRLVATSTDNNARLFDLGSGRLIQLLDGFTQQTTAAKFSRDGNRIVVSSLDGTVRVYSDCGGLLYVLNVTAGTKKGNSIADVAISGDGTSVMAVPIQNNDSVFFWTLPGMADKTPLYNAINAASDIDYSEYTHESVAALREAMESANALLRGHKADASEIAAGVALINNAANHLVKLPGGEVVLNGFDGWTSEDVAAMSSTRATLSLTSSSVSITPNVRQSLCISAGSTTTWTMYNTTSGGEISGRNPFGADLSNSDGISIWAKGLTKEQNNGKIFIGHTGVEGSFLFSASLPTITTSGGYINIPFSDFTYVSGEETLDLTKLNTIGFSGKGAKGMFVFTELTAYTEAGAMPVVTGVTDGAAYNITGAEAPSANWDSGMAFLDGEYYVAGTPITETGEHTLVVNNHGTEATVTFTVTDNTPIPVITGVAERQVFDLANGESASPSWNVGSATLNGEAYNGAAINKVGEYTLTVTNGYKKASVFFIVVDTSENQSVYMKGDMDKDGEITVADALKALRIAAKLAQQTDEDVMIGDTDNDGEITVADALKILRVAAKLADAASLGE